jgi:hypothetical protein
MEGIYVEKTDEDVSGDDIVIYMKDNNIDAEIM